MLNPHQVKRDEEEIRLEVRRMPDAVRARYFAELGPRIKDPDNYAVLNWMFVAGLHHFYLGRWQRGLVNLSVFLIGVALFFIWGWYGRDWMIWASLGAVLGITVVELPALFRSQIIVQDYNNRMMVGLLRDMDWEREQATRS